MPRAALKPRNTRPPIAAHGRMIPDSFANDNELDIITVFVQKENPHGVLAVRV